MDVVESFGERTPYALTPSGAVWQYSRGVEEPSVLRFPAVKVGSVEEEGWCALGEFVHERRGQDGGVVAAVSPALSRWGRDRGRAGGEVALAEIDLLEGVAPSDGWVQPVLEVPPSVPIIDKLGEVAERDQWVRRILGETLMGWASKVEISYCVTLGATGGEHGRTSLLLAVGDLSGRRGWRCLCPSDSDADATPVVPLASALPWESAVPPAREVPPMQVPQLFAPGPVDAPVSADLHAREGAAEMDLVQMGVDTLEIPTLRRRIRTRMRR